MRLFRSTWAVFLCSFFLLGSAVAYGDDLAADRYKMKSILGVVSKDLQKNFYDPKLKGLDWNALVEIARQRIENAKSRREMMRAIYLLVEKLQDSHTKFLPPNTNVEYKFGFDAKPVGDEVRIYRIKKDGVAEKAGLKLGDRILSVNNFRADRATYDTMMFDFRVILNIGVFELKVQTDGEEPRKVRLEAKQKVEAAFLEVDEIELWYLIRDTFSEREPWKVASFKDGIGYVELLGFAFEGEDFFTGLIDKANASRALILDLRSNGGGAVQTLRNFAGNFEDQETVMADLINRASTEKLIIKPRRPHYKMPLFILIDSETGSAAEMFARHFQRTKRAVVIGDRSLGRVTRARYFNEEIGTMSSIPFGVYIGISRVIGPDGLELERTGVTPDIPCTPTGLEMREERDVCLWKAVELARQTLGLPEDKTAREVTKVIGGVWGYY